MDPLSDLLRVVRLDGAFFYEVEAAGSWSIDTVAARELSPRIMPSAEHLIPYHVLTQGRCYAGLIGEEQVELATGDVIVFPHGDAHIMSSEPGVRVTSHVHTTTSTRYAQAVLLGDQASRGRTAGMRIPGLRPAPVQSPARRTPETDAYAQYLECLA